MWEAVNHYVQRNAVFSEEELRYFNSLLEPISVPKKTFLLRQGEICNFEAYINKGCIRMFYINENGMEVVLQLAVEDWWIGDIASFNEQKPSDMYIETLEDSEILTLNRENKEKLLAYAPQFERVFRLMVQRNLVALQTRLCKTISTTARERYLDFVHKYPSIVQRVPQHYIASYLGVSPEFLSKVRTRISRES